MKSLCSFSLLLIMPFVAPAQQIIQLRTLWTKPEVKLIFRDYNIYFRIRDINKAMQFLSEPDKKIYGTTSGLDTNKVYIVELESGNNVQYLNDLQPLLQNAVGSYLLMSGHAAVETKRHKKIHKIEVRIGPANDYDGFFRVPVNIYDPKSGKMIFSGLMDDDMYKKDIGFD
jgi:hypothetical protein